MSFMVDTDARKVAEAKCYAPDDGSDPADPSWIEPRDPEDSGDPIDEDDGWGQYGELNDWGGAHIGRGRMSPEQEAEYEHGAIVERIAKRLDADGWDVTECEGEIADAATAVQTMRGQIDGLPLRRGEGWCGCLRSKFGLTCTCEPF